MTSSADWSIGRSATSGIVAPVVQSMYYASADKESPVKNSEIACGKQRSRRIEVIEFARKCGVEAGFLAFWDSGFRRFVILWARVLRLGARDGTTTG